MEKGNYSYAMYLIALGCGLISGLSLSKAAYFKGKEEAYGKCAALLKEGLQNALSEEEESE